MLHFIAPLLSNLKNVEIYWQYSIKKTKKKRKTKRKEKSEKNNKNSKIFKSGSVVVCHAYFVCKKKMVFFHDWEIYNNKHHLSIYLSNKMSYHLLKPFQLQSYFFFINFYIFFYNKNIYKKKTVWEHMVWKLLLSSIKRVMKQNLHL